MAKLIDAAVIAEENLYKTARDVQILPSERECDYDGKSMTLRIVSNDEFILRIHTCPECGFTKKYGGRTA